MRANGYQNYLEHEVLEANPLRLVQLLYRGSLNSIAAARRHLRDGDIAARSRCIGKAMAIVTELTLSLDAERGGDLGKNLDNLYGYIQKLLIQANFEQRDAPLAEAERLLSTLLEAWTTCGTAATCQDFSQQSKREESYRPVACCD